MALGTGGGSGGGAGGGAGAIRAGGAFVEFLARDRLTPVLEKLQRRFAGLSAGLAKAGTVGLAGGAAILAPLTALFTEGVSRTAEIQRAADALNMPIEQYSRLAHAAEVAGVAVEEVVKDQWRFANLINQAPTIDEATGRKALETQREFTRITIELKSALLPLLNVILPVVSAVRMFAERSSGLLVTLAGVGAGLVAAGGAGLVLSGVFAGLSVAAGATLAVIGAVKAALAAIVTPAGAAVAAVGALGYLFATQTETGRRWSGELGGEFQRLAGVVQAALAPTVETAKTAFGGIRDALSTGDLGLAAEIGLAAVRVEWERFKGWIDGIWRSIVTSVKDALAEVEKAFVPVRVVAEMAWTGIKIGWDEAKKVLRSVGVWVHDNFVEPWLKGAEVIVNVLKSLAGKVSTAIKAALAAVLAPLIAAAAAADAAFGTDTAGTLRDMLNDVKNAVRDRITNAVGQIGFNVDDRRREIDAERERVRTEEQVEANAAAKQVADAVLAATLGLRGLTGQAAAAAEAARNPQPGAAIAAVPTQAELAKVLARGVFSGPLGLQLGAANQFQKQTLDETKKTRIAVEAALDIWKKIQPLAFG